MIGEVNAVTGIYIRAKGVHFWDTDIAAVLRGFLLKSRLVRELVAGGRDGVCFLFIAMVAYNPWRVWQVACGRSERFRSEQCSRNYEAITTIAAELMYCTATTVCLRTGGFKMAVLGSSRSTPCSEE